jgi:autotransporter-associated beta strand protein
MLLEGLTTTSKKNGMKTHQRIHLALVAAVAAALAPAIARADQTKANNGTDLDLTGSWVSGVPPTTTDVAIFDNTLTGGFTTFSTGTSGTAPSWAGIRVANPGGALLINGTTQTLTLGASGIDMSAATQNLTIKANLNVSANQTWNINAGQSILIGDELNGTGLQGASTITQAGPGSLTFVGTANSFAGNIIVTRGNLNLQFDSGAGITSNLLSTASSITLSGGKLSVAGGGAQTLANLTFLTGASKVSVASGNTLSLTAYTKNGSGAGAQGATVMIVPDSNGLSNVMLPNSPNLILVRDSSGLNPFMTFGFNDWAATDGSGNIIAATYTPTSTSGVTAGANVTIDSDVSVATVDVASDRFGDSTAAHVLTVTGTSTHTARGILVTSTSLGGTITGGNIRPSRSSTAGTAFAVIQNSTNADLTIASTFSVASSNGAYQLVKSGPGRLILTSPNNTFTTTAGTGAVDINEGILAPTNNGALGAQAPVGANAIPQINFNGGTLQATINLGLYNGTPGTNNRILQFNEKGGGLDAVTGVTMTVPGVIQGVGMATKTGLGTVAISGSANTWSGGLTIASGVVQLENTAGDATGTGNVIINSGGSLTGTGIATSTVAVNSSGHLSPGVVGVSSGIGVLTVGGLTLNTGSIFDYDASTVSNDLLVVTANGVAVNPGSGINLFAAGTTSPITTNGTYNIMQVTGGSIPSAPTLQSDLTVLNPATGSPVYTWGVNGQFITVTITGLASASQWNFNGGGSWGDGNKWTGGVPNLVGSSATFGPILNPGPATVTLDGSKTVSTLTFNNTNGSYTIAQGSGGSLVLDSGSNTATVGVSGNHVISAPIQLNSDVSISTAAATDSITVSGNIAGSKNVAVGGPGVTIFTGANAYNNTTVNTGANLQVGNGTTVGTIGSGPVSLSGKLTFNHSDNVAVANNIVGTGAVVQSGTGTLSLTSPSNNIGSVIVNSGDFQVLAASPTAAALVMNGGIFDVSDNNVTLTSLSGNGGAIDNLTGVGTVTLTLNQASTSNVVYAGRFNNTNGMLNFVRNGAGTFTVAGTTGTMTGTVLANGGTFAVGATGALGQASLLTVNTGGGATLAINDGVNLDRNVLFTSTSATSGEIMNEPLAANATFSGSMSTVSQVQFRFGIFNSTLTVTGVINNTTNQFTFFTEGNFIFAGTANLMSGAGQIALGRSTQGAGERTSSFVFKDSVIVNSTTGGMGLAISGNGVTNDSATATIQDSAFIDLGAASFDMNNSGAPTTTLNLNGGTLAMSGIAKSNAAGASTLNLNGGKLLVRNDNGSFMSGLTGLTANIGAGGAKFDIDGHSISMDQALTGTADGGLAIASTAGGGSVTLLGANSFQGPTSVATGVTLQFGGNTQSVGTITGGTLQELNGTNVTSDAVNSDSLLIDNNSIHTLRANGTVSTTSKIGTLAIQGTTDAWTGKLQINNNAVIVQTDQGTANKSDVISALKNQVLDGVSGTANGITSASVVADPTHKVTVVVDNGLLGLTSFNGVPVNSASVLVEATYFGDSNLDRKVDVTDLGTLATNYGKSVPNGILQGDFNSDGKVDVTDLGLLATDYGLGTSGSGFTLAGAASAVPEPASLAVLAMGGAALLARRRRK